MLYNYVCNLSMIDITTTFKNTYISDIVTLIAENEKMRISVTCFFFPDAHRLNITHAINVKETSISNSHVRIKYASDLNRRLLSTWL